MIPLQSYGNPPSQSKFAGLDYFEFRLDRVSQLLVRSSLICICSSIVSSPCRQNYVPLQSIPSAGKFHSTTTGNCCKIRARRRVVHETSPFQHQTIIDPTNYDLVHHLLMYECDPAAKFNDSRLPDGLCDDLQPQIQNCSMNLATGWAVGGDEVKLLIFYVCRNEPIHLINALYRLSNFLKWLDIQLEVILKSNTTCCRCITIIRIECQVNAMAEWRSNHLFVAFRSNG